MDLEAILQMLKELEAIDEDKEGVVRIVLASDGSGHFEIDGEDLESFDRLDDLPEAFEDAKRIYAEWLEE